MSRSKRLTSVTKLMAHRELEAARLLKRSRERLEYQHQRLQELLAYQAEYERTYQDTMKIGMNASRMNDYQRFLHQLNQAIQQQQQTVEAADHEHRSSRQQWLNRYSIKSAVNKVADRCRNEEEYAQNKREQKENDDRCHRMKHS